MSRSPLRVLLVDDDEDDFLITRDLLAEIDPRGYAVEWAEDYDTAVQRIASRQHDVYLIDYRLGGSSGLELLRESRKAGVAAPCILLTGLGDHEVDIQAMRAGADDFLVKGQITARSLERSIRYALERKRAETEIQKLAAFPRCHPNPVLEFAADGTLTYFNEAALSLVLSLGRESLENVLPPNTRSIVAECLQTGTNQSNLQTSLHGRTIAWSFVAIPASQVVQCYATEITERLNLEAQLRHSVKMEAVGQLAAGVAHDFNNILTIVQGHASLLQESCRADADSAESLRQITLAAERAGNLIRQLLMFSRKQVMQPTDLDLNEVIGNLTQMLRRLMGEHITLTTLAAPNLPPIHADTGMIEQILMNLAVNARDAMPKGGQLILSTCVRTLDRGATLANPEARPGEFVCLAVQDTGCGMDAATLHRIFEPFFTTKEVGKGTGLGLATVYGIVKQHQGWIEVESEVGVGTTFRFFLPCSTKPLAAGPAATPAERPLVRGRETILVVEDETALRELVVKVLEMHGYRVFAAASGVEALRVWAEHQAQIDLLLTDMVMPEGILGGELAERLLRQAPGLKVIITTGYSPGMAGKDLALLKGANFLPKPYPPSRLAQTVRDCLDQKPTLPLIPPPPPAPATTP